MDTKDIVVILDALLGRPELFNYIEEFIADYLVVEGLFNDTLYTVTDKGLFLLNDLKKTA